LKNLVHIPSEMEGLQMDRLDCDRMFVAVLEAGSFARAAERLRVSSGQASKLVTRLEQDLGVQLLNRTTRALSPTEVGQAYFDQIRRIIEDFDALDATVKLRSSEPSGRLRLTAPLSFGTAQLVPLLLDFMALHPRIDLDVGFSDRAVNLIDEGYDAAVRIGTVTDPTLIARKIGQSRIILAASPAYLRQHGTPTTPADLINHQCVIDTNLRDPLTWNFRQPGGGVQAVRVTGRLRVSNADACLMAAERDHGIIRSPSFIVGPALARGTLAPVLPAFEDTPLGINVLYPPTRHLTTKVRALVDFLLLRFKGTPPWEFGW
jgi:DNA-binding transcriptional LysR family regulator